MPAEEIKVGDTVKMHLTNSPQMLVSEVMADGKCRVLWFDDAVHLVQDVFPSDCLALADKSARRKEEEAHLPKKV